MVKIFLKYGARGTMDRILNPKANKFKVERYNKFTYPTNREVWVSGPCLVIFEDLFYRIAGGNDPRFRF